MRIAVVKRIGTRLLLGAALLVAARPAHAIPMPSFSDALKPDQVWDIVHYIHTLRTNKGQPTQSQPEPKAE